MTDKFDTLFEDEIGLGEGYYKTEPTGNGRYPSQMQWFKFLDLVKEMRTVQKSRERYNAMDFKTIDGFEEHVINSYERVTDLEYKVDNMIKELFK